MASGFGTTRCLLTWISLLLTNQIVAQRALLCMENRAITVGTTGVVVTLLDTFVNETFKCPLNNQVVCVFVIKVHSD